MNLEQIRKGIILSAISITLSGISLAYVVIGVQNQPVPDTGQGNMAEIIETPIVQIQDNVLGARDEINYYQFKPIFLRALTTFADKKTVEFYETRINESRIRYYYQNDHRNKRFYRYADYNIEDFKSLEELEKKLDVAKEVYIDGIFYIIDTKGFTTVTETDAKRFENSTVHINDIKTNFEKYLELYEESEGMVSVMELKRNSEDELLKTRYGFQSQELGDAVVVIDENFDIWQLSIDFKGVYSTFVFESYNSDLNIEPLDQDVELVLDPNAEVSPSPTPEVTAEVSASPTPEVLVSPTVSASIANTKSVLGAEDNNPVPSELSPNAAKDIRLSGSCSTNKGTCYLEYTIDTVIKQLAINECSTDCESRRTILSLSTNKYQYIVEAKGTVKGYTELFAFDRDTYKIQKINSFDQNLVLGFDITKIDTLIDIKLANYTEGCFEVDTVGLYCVGNLNKMNESDVKIIENYIGNASKFFRVYIAPYK